MCLVDTRKADGTPTGTDGSKPLRANRWAKAVSKVKQGMMVRMQKGAVLSCTASTIAKMPEETASPKVEKIDVACGKARVHVSQAASYASWTLHSGSHPSSIREDMSSSVEDGRGSSTIVLESSASEKMKLFKVERKL